MHRERTINETSRNPEKRRLSGTIPSLTAPGSRSDIHLYMPKSYPKLYSRHDFVAFTHFKLLK
jgi:hypothetical protein